MCENKGNVQAIGFGKASGIVSEIQSWKTNKYIEIKKSLSWQDLTRIFSSSLVRRAN